MIDNLKTYDIVLVDFGKDTIDSEQAGIRPAIVIQNNMGNFFSDTTIVIPFTSKNRNLNQSTHTLIKKDINKGLICDSIALGECVRQVSKRRILKKLGKLTNNPEKSAIREIYYANFGE